MLIACKKVRILPALPLHFFLALFAAHLPSPCTFCSSQVIRSMIHSQPAERYTACPRSGVSELMLAISRFCSSQVIRSMIHSQPAERYTACPRSGVSELMLAISRTMILVSQYKG